MRMTRILIIDDDPKICKNLSEILSEDEYLVKTSTSSKAGLKLVKKEDFDLAIIDLIMPEMGGMELLFEIKRNKPDVLVIMITGFATIETAVEAMKRGTSDYISKPFKAGMIQTTVKKVLEEASFKKRISEFEKSPIVGKIISSLDNSMRREIVIFLGKRVYPFTGIMKGIEADDPTKFNFHLKKLKTEGLVDQDVDKKYFLTDSGRKALNILIKLKEH